MRRLVIWTVVVAGVAALGFGAFKLFHRDTPPTVARYGSVMCSKPQGFTQAPARSTTPPHPVLVYGWWNVREQHADMFSRAELDMWDPTDPAKVQLVACVEHIGSGAFLTQCEYPSGSGSYDLRLYKGNFQVTVYEVHTGKIVAVLRVDGDNFGPDQKTPPGTCPFVFGARPGDPHVSNRDGDPYIQQIKDALAPYVTG